MKIFLVYDNSDELGIRSVEKAFTDKEKAMEFLKEEYAKNLFYKNNEINFESTRPFKKIFEIEVD